MRKQIEGRCSSCRIGIPRANRKTCEKCARRHTEKQKRRGYAWHLKRRYGLSEASYNELLMKHGRKCAICRREKKLVVDHDHKTGRVRGLLCTRCNLTLGSFGDNLEYFLAIISYLLVKDVDRGKARTDFTIQIAAERVA